MTLGFTKNATPTVLSGLIILLLFTALIARNLGYEWAGGGGRLTHCVLSLSSPITTSTPPSTTPSITPSTTISTTQPSGSRGSYFNSWVTDPIGIKTCNGYQLRPWVRTELRYLAGLPNQPEEFELIQGTLEVSHNVPVAITSPLTIRAGQASVVVNMLTTSITSTTGILDHGCLLVHYSWKYLLTARGESCENGDWDTQTGVKR